MVSLEQIKLLESKVTRTIDYVKKVTEEKNILKEKLDSYQKRIDELEVLVQQFKQEQSRIEDGILSALDRLNQFEDALENKLSGESKAPRETDHPQTPPAAKGKKDSQEEKKTPGPIIEPEPLQSEEKSSEAGELDIF